MFKETAVDKLIEYIQALPKNEQMIIAKKIGVRKKSERGISLKKTQKKILEYVTYSQKPPTRLPKDYKFDREEANER